MKKVLLIVLPLIIIIGGILGGGYYIYETDINLDTIYEGIKIDGHNVGGKTKVEAMEFLSKQKEIDNTDKSINLSYEEKIYHINLSDIGYSYDYEAAINEAYDLGREGNVFNRYSSIKSFKRTNKLVELKPTYDRDLVLKLVDGIEDDINQDSKDATLEFKDGNFVVYEEMAGRTLRKGELINLIIDNINELKDINIPVDKVEAMVTKKLLGRINGIIGQFSTSFKGSSYGRIQNIKVASQSVSNMLVMPGEQISFNDQVGPINGKYGFMEAPVILNGELTPGMGGGVCQSSTTLYNALLLADVSIVERHPHSIAASYVPRGTDGAVASGYLDLKFKNDFDFPIYIDSEIIGNNIKFYIYGDTTSKDYSVKIEPELIQTLPYKVVEVLDQNAQPGSRELTQEGRTGYKVRTYKSIIKDGKVIERNLINSDYYREKNFIYKVGPALPETVDLPIEPTVPAQPLEPIDENIEVIDIEPGLEEDFELSF